MDHDLVLVAGLVLAVIAIPAMFAARAEFRKPRISGGFLVLAIGLIAWAWLTYPGGLHISDIPHLFYGVIGRILH